MKYIGAKAQNIKIIELSVFVIGWMAIFSIPFFSHRINNALEWNKLVGEWIRISSFLIIFLVTIYVMVPKFLFQKKYLLYFGFAFLVILLVLGLNLLLGLVLNPPQPLSMPPMDLGPGMPPMELGNGMPAPLGYRPANLPEQKSLVMTFIDNLIISVLIVGAGTSIKMMSQWLKEEDRRIDSEKEQLKTELAFLRLQVSPHFFMNTLNNIHALIDINPEDAKNTIIELSTMMRYLLYDTAKGHTTLKKEIAFIESYITLMQLRFPRKVAVTVEVPENICDVQLPPMLFISFLENAFKHGVSYQASSFVSFKIEQTADRLKCNIRNSKHISYEKPDRSYSGIGLTNIKQSLNLLFGKDYQLDIHESDIEFEVQLNIPVNENKMSGH
jgi:hypothetical protein